MEAIIYFLVLLTCFLGLFIGILISFMAKEELKDGKKYFLFIKKIIFALIIFFLLFYLKINLILNLLIALILLFILFKVDIKEIITYNLLGIVFYISSLNQSLFKINASLIFIYGLFVGSLFTEDNIKSKKFEFIKKLMVNHIWFMIIGTLGLLF